MKRQEFCMAGFPIKGTQRKNSPFANSIEYRPRYEYVSVETLYSNAAWIGKGLQHLEDELALAQQEMKPIERKRILPDIVGKKNVLKGKKPLESVPVFLNDRGEVAVHKIEDTKEVLRRSALSHNLPENALHLSSRYSAAKCPGISDAISKESTTCTGCRYLPGLGLAI